MNYKCRWEKFNITSFPSIGATLNEFEVFGGLAFQTMPTMSESEKKRKRKKGGFPDFVPGLKDKCYTNF